MKRYHVYILASFHRVLYIGITADLEKRLAYHRALANPNSFSARYAVTRLVHVEEFTNPDDAIAREKQLKGWLRAKKVADREDKSRLGGSGSRPHRSFAALRRLRMT
jgi:putative endonuclease